jgi:hypothetical protein
VGTFFLLSHAAAVIPQPWASFACDDRMMNGSEGRIAARGGFSP